MMDPPTNLELGCSCMFATTPQFHHRENLQPGKKYITKKAKKQQIAFRQLKI